MSPRPRAARLGSAPQHERADREGILGDLDRVICDAWASFDAPRPSEPELDETLAARLQAPLPEAAGDAGEALDDAARVLDASISPSRPLYLGYIGSTGLEVGVLASALAATYDVNLAVTAGGADLVEQQSLRWVAEFIGFPFAEGAFTSGGMASNLTALLAAREAGVAIVDGVYNDVKDLEGFEAECRQGAEMGFDGKTLVHPTQVDVANRVWAPSEDEVAHARKVVDAFAEAEREGRGVVTVDGRMVENLHRDNALRTLAVADAIAALAP